MIVLHYKEEEGMHLFHMSSLHSLSTVNSQEYQSANSPDKNITHENKVRDGSRKNNFFPICRAPRSEEFHSCGEKEFEIKCNNAKKMATNFNDTNYIPSPINSISGKFADDKNEEIFCQVVSMILCYLCRY